VSFLRSRWYSTRVRREVTMARWGYFGQPVLIFPTAGGDAEEVERWLVIRVLEPLIGAGRIKVYSCDSVAGQAWFSEEGSAGAPHVAHEHVSGVRAPRGGAGHPSRLP
jgi:esterase/lipase superfamily enzyme